MADPDGSSLEDLFQRALDVAPELREEFLQRESGGDFELLERLRALLAEDARGTASILAHGTDAFVVESARIGRYTVLKELGSGGMGTVLLARQEEPVERLVALKMIRKGADSDEVIKRFELERQTLAMMNHPGIARIYDGGATDDGRPYFVMEYVKGPPITDYCDQNRLDLRARLTLVCRVCDAVQHAHQKGVIHRDLKPGNLLVTEQSGAPIPKVIDFGVARAVSKPPGLSGSLTAVGGVVGSFFYMSPEQADPKSRELDTRTDIYSLGVVLFELLAGALPIDSTNLETQGFLQFQRALLEDDPPGLSTCYGTLPTPDQEQIARLRSSTVRLLRRQLQDDLEWIVHKALEKDRARRYASASELGADIQRFLDGEAVSAGPPTVSYLASKFVRRHLAAVTSGALLLLVLVAGTVGTTLGMLNAHAARDAEAEQRRRALVQLEKSRAVTEFLDLLLFYGDPASSDQNPTLKDLLDAATESIDELFQDRPNAEAAVRAVVGRAYLQLAEPRTAEQQLRLALQIQELRAEEPAELFLTLDSLIHAARMVRPDGGDAYIRQSLALATKALADSSVDLREAVADLVALTSDPEPASDNALKRLQAVLDAFNAHRRQNPLNRRDDLRVVGRVVAEVWLYLDEKWELAGSPRFFQELEKLVRDAYTKDIRRLPLLQGLAERQLLSGRFEEARRLSDDVYKGMANLDLRNHWLAIESRRTHVTALIGLGESAQAEEEARTLRRRLRLMPTKIELIRAASWSKEICRVLDEHGRLEGYLRESWSAWQQDGDRAERWWLVDSRLPATVFELIANILTEALQSSDSDSVRGLLGAVHLRLHRDAEALDLLERAARNLLEPEPELLADLVVALHRVGRKADAETALDRLAELADRAEGPARQRAEGALENARAALSR